MYAWKKAESQKKHCKLCHMWKSVSWKKQESIQKSVPNLVQDGGPAAQRGKTVYAVFPNACTKTAGENKAKSTLYYCFSYEHLKFYLKQPQITSNSIQTK